jgi:hypothetical protein
MIQLVNRIPPNMAPEAYVTYRILAPITTHWMPATCEQVECEAFIYGWTIAVDEATELGQRQAHYIRHDRTRSARESRSDAGLTVFDFGAGQQCFAASQHKRQVRPDQFIVDGGDWRGNPRRVERRVHTDAKFWVEDFAENQDKLHTLIEKG